MIPADDNPTPATVQAWWVDMQEHFAKHGVNVNEYDPSFQRSMFYAGYQCALFAGLKRVADVATGSITPGQSLAAVKGEFDEIAAFLTGKAGLDKS